MYRTSVKITKNRHLSFDNYSSVANTPKEYFDMLLSGKRHIFIFQVPHFSRSQQLRKYLTLILLSTGEAQGVLRIFVYGGMRTEGKIQTQKHGFPENFAPKHIGILHISYPQIWVKIVF